MENIRVSLQQKQEIAYDLSLNTPITFFGGAKGGGKSHLVRARELLRRLEHPGTRGLIVRKTYPELLANHIRPFFKEYPQTRGWYNKSEKVIQWPNGSTTEFSYLKNTDDVYTYQGREYEDITIDEITQHEQEVFQILRSSLRTANVEFGSKASPSMFLTGNPGGIGHGWVKRLFIDKQYDDKENPNDYGFVQAKVGDNKALLDADPEYIKRLEDLPEDKRRAYLDGDWDVFTGQVFHEWRKIYHVVEDFIPDGKDSIYISIDWGYSEKSAFAAYLHVIKKDSYDGQNFNRVVTFKEWYGNQKSPEDWAITIMEYCKKMKFKIERGYTDPAMHNTQTDGSTSIAQLMSKYWKKNNFKCNLERANNNRIARVATVHNWLKIAPDGLPYWMVTEGNKDLIRTLPMLVYDDNKVDDVDTDMEDHCLLGDTKIISYNGVSKIKDLVNTTGRVLSLNGEWVSYTNCKLTRENTKLIELTFSDGSNLICTPDHKVLTSKGMVEAQSLKGSFCLSTSSHQQYKSLMERDTINVENIIQDKRRNLGGQKGFIGLFGNIISALLNLGITSITKITIGITTVLKTLLRWLHLSIYQSTQNSTLRQKNIWIRLEKRLSSGTNQKRVGSGTGSIMKKQLPSFIKIGLTKFVKSVLRSSQPLLRVLDSVSDLARLRVDVSQGLITLKSNVLNVEYFSKEVNILVKSVVQEHALVRCVGAKHLKKRADTYCLTAEKYHVFSLENGVIVSNSYDSIGYFLMHVKFTSVKPGAFSVLKGEKKVRLTTDERGLPIVNPTSFFGG